MIRIRELRKAKKMTMRELGEVIGVAESTVSLYELGKREPDYSTLVKIANYFNVPVDFLLGNGVFANWEAIKKYKKPIIITINQLMGFKLCEEDVNDTDFIRIINSAFAKIDINSDGVIDVYPLLPISEFKKIPLQLDKHLQDEQSLLGYYRALRTEDERADLLKYAKQKAAISEWQWKTDHELQNVAYGGKSAKGIYITDEQREAALKMLRERDENDD